MGVYDDNPCRGCVPPKREPGCHGWCKERKEWREKFDSVKEMQRKETEDRVEIGKIISATMSNSRRKKK